MGLVGFFLMFLCWKCRSSLFREHKVFSGLCTPDYLTHIQRNKSPGCKSPFDCRYITQKPDDAETRSETRGNKQLCADSQHQQGREGHSEHLDPTSLCSLSFKASSALCHRKINTMNSQSLLCTVPRCIIDCVGALGFTWFAFLARPLKRHRLE